MRMLSNTLPGELVTADQIGWSSAYLEAQAFGFLAVRTLKGLPITFPLTTGVSSAQTGGILAQPKTARSSKP